MEMIKDMDLIMKANDDDDLLSSEILKQKYSSLVDSFISKGKLEHHQ